MSFIPWRLHIIDHSLRHKLHVNIDEYCVLDCIREGIDTVEAINKAIGLGNKRVSKILGRLREKNIITTDNKIIIVWELKKSSKIN